MSEPEAKAVKALVDGHVPVLAASLLEIDYLHKALLETFTDKISQECAILCRRDADACFHKILVSKLAGFSWNMFIAELRLRAPTLLHIMTTVASFNDHRNLARNIFQESV